jgi:hypothetical protein
MLPTAARFVRLVFRSNYGSDRAVALGEVSVYEAIDTSDPVGGLISRLEGAISDLRRYREIQLEGGNGGGQIVKAKATGNLAPATLQLVQLLAEGEGRVRLAKPTSRSPATVGRSWPIRPSSTTTRRLAPTN